MAKDLAKDNSEILHLVQGRGRNVRDLFEVRNQILKQWKPDVVIMNDTHAVVLAGLATLLALIIGFPIAYYIAKIAKERSRAALFLMCLIPL